MSEEVTYDNASGAEVIRGERNGSPQDGHDLPGDPELGCHSGSEMETAARMAGQSEILDRYAKDYPQGPQTSRRACARHSAVCLWDCG